ncbi:hypothetical protein [Brumimicrobium oceani]|uniref:Uncharacterized protein n=1 Tax=Brumimicrobium oceani TaxID=2100725 RepID=A0A2U2XA85_9FLAO|nr:hypothetical protein [Brumimicrobium oceani]PWH84667.1 hypothetical protein DIT68_13155 [Brumimicrobium oceani]
MKFISFRRLAAIFKLEISEFNADFIQALSKSIEQYFQSHKVLRAYGEDFTQKQLTFILAQLQEKEAHIFHEWIEDDHLLVEYLFSKGEIILPDEEVILPKDSPLFKQYKSFLRPFLVPILSDKIGRFVKEENLIELKDHMKFSPFLSQENRVKIEKPIVLFLDQSINQLKVSYGRDFEIQLTIVYSLTFIDVLNALDKSYYYKALNYFETTKLLVKRNDLSPMLLDKVEKSLRSLDVKEEDRTLVESFISSAAFASRRKAPKPRLIEMVKSPFFIVAVILVLLNFVFADCEG